MKKAPVLSSEDRGAGIAAKANGQGTGARKTATDRSSRREAQHIIDGSIDIRRCVSNTFCISLPPEPRTLPGPDSVVSADRGQQKSPGREAAGRSLFSPLFYVAAIRVKSPRSSRRLQSSGRPEPGQGLPRRRTPRTGVRERARVVRAHAAVVRRFAPSGAHVDPRDVTGWRRWHCPKRYRGCSFGR